MTWQEILGYTASIVIAISLMMRSIVRLRWVNLVGAALFTVYGIIIAAYPVAVLNAMIVAINLYFLWKAHRRVESFSAIEMPVDSPYIAEFVRFHQADIARFQPEFAFTPDAGQRAILGLRDLVPAGLVILDPAGERTARVVLDFVTAAYRDFRVGPYIFGRRADLFRAMGFDRLISAAGTPDHTTYLQKLGFVPTAAGELAYTVPTTPT